MGDDANTFDEIKAAVDNGVTDRAFWHSRTPQERVWAVLLMNARHYGYEENSPPRMERIIEVATRTRYGNPPQSE